MHQRLESLPLRQDLESDPIPSCKSKVKENKFCYPVITPCSSQKKVKNKHKKISIRVRHL